MFWLIFLWLQIGIKADTIYLQNPQLALEFPNSQPSFSINISNRSSSYILQYNYLSVSEYSGGNIILTYDIPDNYQINRSISYLVNETRVKIDKLSFTTNFPNNATLVFTYTLVCTNSTSQFPVNLFDNNFIMSDERTLVFFDILLLDWNFQSTSNSLGANVQVVANVDPLSLGYSQTSTGYSLSMPFSNGQTLSAVLPTIAQIDNGTVIIVPVLSITSYSPPSATALLQLPYFSHLAEYKAYFQIVSSVTSVNPLSIIIIVCILAFFICCGTALGCFIYREHKKSQIKIIDEATPSEEKNVQEKKNPVKTYQTVTTTVSLSDVFKMKV